MCRVVYHYPEEIRKELGKPVLSDTLIKSNDVLIRNLTSSFYDSIPDDNILYGELKIQSNTLLNDTMIFDEARSFLDSKSIDIDFISKRNDIRPTRYIGYGLLSGLFSGMILLFFPKIKKP